MTPPLLPLEPRDHQPDTCARIVIAFTGFFTTYVAIAVVAGLLR